MLTLRETTAADLGWVVAMETAPDTRQWLGETGLAWHERALADPDQEHLVAGDGTALAGFVVLAGLRRADRVIELRRMVVAAAFRGSGRGRALLQTALDRACHHHRARRVWLDVKTGNLRARSLYASAGLTVAPALATVMPEPDAAASDLLVMEHEVPLK
jgi:diamine N-acetyltransferase